MHWNTFAAPDPVASSAAVKLRALPISEMKVADGSSVVALHIASG